MPIGVLNEFEKGRGNPMTVTEDAFTWHKSALELGNAP
jgi:hypothetical protein